MKRANGSADSMNQVLDLMKSVLRREALFYLSNNAHSEVDFDALVAHLHEESPGVDRQREEIAIELYHYYLPKLVDEGLISFDSQNQVIRYSPDENLEEWLTHFRDLEGEFPA